MNYVGNGPGQFSVIPPLLPYKAGEWMLLQDLIYTSKAGKQYVTPKYFITDLASIPWVVQPIFDAVDTRIAGIMHDGLYCMNREPQFTCDLLLSEMLAVTGCDATRRSLIYSGVNTFGRNQYNACKGGPKLSDFAWEFMTPYEVTLYKTAYKIGG